jgi:hypothetical protein
MKQDSFINEFKLVKAQVSYRDDSGKYHSLFGWVVEETSDSFIIKPDDSRKNLVLLKKQIVIISWLKHQSTGDTKQEHKGSPSNLKHKKKRGFSYARW